MKKLVLLFVVVYNAAIAQDIINCKQDIYRALDTVGIPNIASPNSDLDAAGAYIATLVMNHEDVDLKAVSDSFNINVYRYFIYGFQYWTPEIWKEMQLKNIIRRHAPLHELAIEPTFMSVAIDEFEGGIGNHIVIIAYGVKEAICGLPKRD
jgi:hypothetical protein